MVNSQATSKKKKTSIKYSLKKSYIRKYSLMQKKAIIEEQKKRH